MFTKNFRAYENLHILFWLVKDACWALEYKTLGVFMIFPTLILAIILSIRTKNILQELFPNLAITLWIIANSIWMCDEFFGLRIKNYCYAPFSIGLLLITYWLIAYFPKMAKERNNI